MVYSSCLETSWAQLPALPGTCLLLAPTLEPLSTELVLRLEGRSCPYEAGYSGTVLWNHSMGTQICWNEGLSTMRCTGRMYYMGVVKMTCKWRAFGSRYRGGYKLPSRAYAPCQAFVHLGICPQHNNYLNHELAPESLFSVSPVAEHPN
jgi:hypothetical protein